MNVVITNLPSGKFAIGPRSTGGAETPSPVNDGRTAKPSDGSVTPAPITAPSPMVDSVRKPARPYVSRCWSSAAASPGDGLSPISSWAAAWSTGACVRAVSRIQRRPKTIARAAPRTAAGQLITRPMRRTAIPIANPTGQRLWCWVSSGPSFTRVSPWTDSTFRAPCLSTTQQLRQCPTSATILHFCAGRCAGYPELAPPRIHARPDLIAHLDLERPLAPPFIGAFRRCVDPDLAAVRLDRRRVVELVDRPLAEQDVAGGIDVRTRVEEDLLVVVHVDVRVDDDHGFREAHQAE